MHHLIEQLDRHNDRRLHLAVVIARQAADGNALRAATLAEFREADDAYVKTLNALSAQDSDDLAEPIEHPDAAESRELRDNGAYGAPLTDPAWGTEPECCS